MLLGDGEHNMLGVFFNSEKWLHVLYFMAVVQLYSRKQIGQEKKYNHNAEK